MPPPSATPAPYPKISYPDLSGALTLQPRYPSHSSVSTNDTYALYSPSSSVAYYANDQSNTSFLPVASYTPATSNPSSHYHIPPDSQHYQHDQSYQQQEEQQYQQQPGQLSRQQHAQRRLQLLRARQRQQLSHQHATADIQISSNISNSAHHDRLIGLFWEAFLPNAKPLPTKTLQITLGGAVGAIGSFDWNGDILHRGLLAMALTTVGKRQLALQSAGGAPMSAEAERMRREGIRLYGSSLQQMSQMLGARTKWTTEHWVTTRLFSLYEVCNRAS